MSHDAVAGSDTGAPLPGVVKDLHCFKSTNQSMLGPEKVPSYGLYRKPPVNGRKIEAACCRSKLPVRRASAAARVEVLLGGLRV